MDCKAMAHSMGLEEDEFLEVLTLFIEVSESDLLNMETGLKKQDAKFVSDAAHSIKGAALNLGLTDISEIARGVEMRAREENLQGIFEASNAIREKLEAIQSVTRIR
jgi:histidine phosphotransfer protein HptB